MNNSVQVAAAAIKAGVNLDCSNMLQDDVIKAYKQNLLTATEIDSALVSILRTQFKLGFYDEKNKVPFSKLGAENIHAQNAIDLSRIAAQQSMVLLKNNNGLLPLDRNKLHSIAVVGPNAGTIEPLLGNYHGMSGNMITFAEGITEAAGPAVAVQYDQGSDYHDTTHFGGIWMAGESDVTIVVIGLTPVLEGEEGDAFLSANAGDRTTLSLPAAHIKLLKQLKQNGKPLIAVINAGSAVDISAIESYADAIVLAWYPGEQGGNALADILFGKVSPSGRLPITFYQSLNDLPAYEDYKVANRTYRYFNGKVQYPFGYGLSYSSFVYQWKQTPGMTSSAKDTMMFSITINNTGAMDADEVAQVYIQYPSKERMPIKELKNFKRVNILKGETQTLQFYIPVNELKKWDLDNKQWKLYSGEYHVMIGAGSLDIRLNEIIKIGN
jgi:beta-glucosidase